MNGSITSMFGYRTDPITGETIYHSGTNITAPNGTPILAAADETVVVANGVNSRAGSYGYYVKLDHRNGLQTLYAHYQSTCVTAGQQVQAEQVIGYWIAPITYILRHGAMVGATMRWNFFRDKEFPIVA